MTRTVLRGGSVFDGTGAAPTTADVAVEDARIVDVGPGLDRFYQGARNLEATLRAGVTSIRDAGFADLETKRARDDGLITGPRMQISLAMISQTREHGDTWLPSGRCTSMDGS